MVKFIVRKQGTLEKFLKHKFFSRFIIFPIDKFQEINNPDLFCKASSLFQLRNTTTKTTNVNRFKETEESWQMLLQKEKQYIIHDIAVSNGITSLELKENLEKNDIKFKLIISDKFSTFFVRKKKLVSTVLDSDKNLLHFYFLGLFASDKINGYYFLSKLLFYFLKAITNPVYKEPSYKKFLLYYYPIQDAMNNSEISEIYYDVFETKFNGEFDVVRAMNIINGHIFSTENLKIAVNNILNSLKENGLLLVGITDSAGVNNAGWYKKENNHFKLIKSFNKGFVHDDIILNA